MDRPRALLLDDDELDRVFNALVRAGLEPLHVSGRDVRDGLPMPCDLLVTSGPRTLKMPCLNVSSPGPAPTWICIHTQDFHPLRERLRGLGVHYLVQASADDRTLDLFLEQLLHRGRERRRDPRLAVGSEIRWSWKARVDQKAALLDLSPRGVRIAMHEELPVGAVLELTLPAQLAGDVLEVAARVARCETSRGIDGERFDVLLVWDELEPGRRLVIDELVGGARIGPRVAPLAPRPYVDGEGIPDWGELQGEAERRGAQRHSYAGHVDAFSESGPIGALGRDLSHHGLRIEASHSSAIEIGDSLTVALHAGDCEEPVLAAAHVARRDPDGALLLLFDDLDEAARSGIARMLAELPPVAAIGDAPHCAFDAFDELDERSELGAPGDQRVVAAEITRN